MPVWFARLVGAGLIALFPANGWAEVEWTLRTSPAEAAPKSFPTASIQLHNRGNSDATFTVEMDTDSGLRSVSQRNLKISLAAGEEKTLLHTLYVLPNTAGGRDAEVRVRLNGELRRSTLRIKAAPAFKVKAISPETCFVRPGEPATYRIRLENCGNSPLDFECRAKTSPELGTSKPSVERMSLAPGAATEIDIAVKTGVEIAEYTALVSIVELKALSMPAESASEFLYFHTEVFPQHSPTGTSQLFETLKGSFRLGMGTGDGNDGDRRGAEAVFREELAVEGMIAEDTRLDFLQSATHPSEGGSGANSSALSALPSQGQRNFFHLGFHHSRFDVELGEISTAPIALLSSRETGDGARVAYRPREALELEAFAERNTLTVNKKNVFGAGVNGSSRTSLLESWRIGTLSKRGDVGPQGKDWDAVAFRTGVKLRGSVPLRAELSAGAGRNNEGGSGAGGLAGLHYNRTLPGEKDTSPLKAGMEFATAGKGFPGAQNGRTDRRAYLNLRLSASPVYAEAYFNFNSSTYKVLPIIEKTLIESQDVAPDFLLTSQSRLVNGGLRWKNQSTSWLPSGGIEYAESELFSRGNFLDRGEEKAFTLSLQPFDVRRNSAAPRAWDLTVHSRAGSEVHQNGNDPQSRSRFVSLGLDGRWSQPTGGWFERVSGPGMWSLDFSGRYTSNLDDDRQAFNRTGITISATATLQTKTWNARAVASLYSYESEGLSQRFTAGITRRLNESWWTGIEAAYVRRGDSASSGDAGDETAVMLTFRHDFDIAVPWLPRRGQAKGVVFDDLNNNGVSDPGEPGLAGVKVKVGGRQTLSGANGQFSLPAMDGGKYPLAVIAAQTMPLNQSRTHTQESVKLTRGEVTPLAIALIKPTPCEGRVLFAREKLGPREVIEAINAGDDSPNLSGIEIVATDLSGRMQRSVTRADGFFSIYLEPGIYQLEIDPAGIRTQQSVTPGRHTLTVERSRIENLEFTITERSRRIRKTFTAKTAQNE